MSSSPSQPASTPKQPTALTGIRSIKVTMPRSSSASAPCPRWRKIFFCFKSEAADPSAFTPPYVSSNDDDDDDAMLRIEKGVKGTARRPASVLCSEHDMRPAEETNGNDNAFAQILYTHPSNVATGGSVVTERQMKELMVEASRVLRLKCQAEGVDWVKEELEQGCGCVPAHIVPLPDGKFYLEPIVSEADAAVAATALGAAAAALADEAENGEGEGLENHGSISFSRSFPWDDDVSTLTTDSVYNIFGSSDSDDDEGVNGDASPENGSQNKKKNKLLQRAANRASVFRCYSSLDDDDKDEKKDEDEVMQRAMNLFQPRPKEYFMLGISWLEEEM